VSDDPGEGEQPRRKTGDPLDTLSTVEILREITQEVERLAKTEVALAKAELRADLAVEVRAATRVGVAVVAGLAALDMALVTGVLALARAMPAWLAGLVMTVSLALVAAVAGIVGWTRRVKAPLSRTRHELEEDVKWTKKKRLA
jgi:uncharacterized membrane protein YqjE